MLAEGLAKAFYGIRHVGCNAGRKHISMVYDQVADKDLSEVHWRWRR